MCGIVGYSGPRKAIPLLLQGLKRLEYRGYDSAGIAFLKRGKIANHKKTGKVAVLEADLPADADTHLGIGHTRWATHGGVTDANAHPHLGEQGKVAVVHNGIIDNYAQLKKELIDQGVHFASATDSEVVAHLVERALNGNPVEAVNAILPRLSGTFGLVFMFADHPGLLIGARRGSPLVIGIGDKELFLASDPQAFIGHTREVVWLDDGDLAVLENGKWEVRTFDNEVCEKDSQILDWKQDAADLGDHPHYFLKEVMEQPEALWNCLGAGGRIMANFGTAKLGGLNLETHELAAMRRVVFIAMGSALYAAQCACELIKNLARIPAEAMDASELRTSNPVLEEHTLYFAVSQSGETADTMTAVQEIMNRGGKVHGVVNAVGSSLARLCNSGIYLHAGPEYSVASTKAFSNQVLVGLLVALVLGRQRHISPGQGQEITAALVRLPELVRQTLACGPLMKELAQKLTGSRHFLFLGRNTLLPIAKEGALKLKELAYYPAEAYPTGALKHGPLALVEPNVPSLMLIPGDSTLDRDLANLQEIKARQGLVIAITPSQDERIKQLADQVVQLPQAPDYLMPLLMVIPLQFFAYELACATGVDVDRPRNLAKSVTVD